MATSLRTDAKLYDEFVREALPAEIDNQLVAFNQSAFGVIRMFPQDRRGDYFFESFQTLPSNIVTRRDATSTSSATKIKQAQGERIEVKLKRKIGPLSNTLDALRHMGLGGPTGDSAIAELAAVHAEQYVKAMQVEMFNQGVRAARAALDNQSSVKFTVPSSGTLETQYLASGLEKFGDAAQMVRAWIMHPNVYYDLVRHQLSQTNNGDIIAAGVVREGSPVTMNRPVILSESAPLKVAQGTSPETYKYYTLGLVEGAINLPETRSLDFYTEVELGNENIESLSQGEYDYDVGLKGFKWDTANGGLNPTDATVGTGSNWDTDYSDRRDFAGIVVESTATNT